MSLVQSLCSKFRKIQISNIIKVPSNNSARNGVVSGSRVSYSGPSFRAISSMAKSVAIFTYTTANELHVSEDTTVQDFWRYTFRLNLHSLLNIQENYHNLT